MALSTIEFFNLASKLVPLEFDGSFDKLQSFLDSLALLQEFDGSFDKLQSFLDSLALLQANSEGHADRALAFVKTRLTGKARELINDDMTIDDILKALKSNIKGESSKVVSAKLLNLKQNFKGTSKFATEIESLATSLKRAYITEGVPNVVAQMHPIHWFQFGISYGFYDSQKEFIYTMYFLFSYLVSRQIKWSSYFANEAGKMIH
ncbi:hypothetical protein QE152_g24754 [Popillia japonica]|uniref:Uncharacterized protein n=1 Tax=Popillia japonica TaxID=7064 RepID=A0AAW1K3U1_POPJA